MGWVSDNAACTCRLPRSSVLCRLLVAMIALLVFIQAISCGMFFCVTLPFGHRPYLDYSDLITELDHSIAAPAAALPSSSTAAANPSSLSRSLQAPAPKLIPRVIHQTYRSKRVPSAARPVMRSWARLNGAGWQMRFYSDEACLSFVRREFPEYLEAYMSLPKDVERADFFRYMVVLRLGGVYADIDVESKQPLDSVIQAADTLLVGWDSELPDMQLAAQHSFPRQRQLASWFFAAAPGHPVLRQLCDHIARNARTVFSNNTVRDTQERTGQGIWTDLVLQHALDHPAAKHDDPWKFRVLPRIAFGVHPAAAGSSDIGVSDDVSAAGPLSADLPGVVVLHHFLGSWQQQGSWARQGQSHRKALQVLAPLLPFRRAAAAEQEPPEPVAASNISHFPVSISFNPAFTMMTDLVGTGDAQAAADVSAAVTAHGTWQPGMAPFRKPAVVEALVGALSRHSRAASNSPIGTAAAPAPAAAAAAAAGNVQAAAAGVAAAVAAAEQLVQQRGVLVDVGAGHGFFSLAAAARGHKVIAFEASPGSVAAFRASIAYNGFGGLIELHDREVLGSASGKVCLQQQEQQETGMTGDAAAAAASNAAGPAGSRTGNGSGAAAAAANSSSSSSSVAQSARHRMLRQEVLLRRRRGYPHLADGTPAAVNADSSSSGNSSASSSCTVVAERRRLSDVLGSSTSVAALRLSVHGHEGWVLQGALDWLGTVHQPEVVYVEFCPAAMRAAGYARPEALLQQLFALGYTDVAHAGRACDKRWLNATAVLRSQASFDPTARAVLQQPTWCKLRPEAFQLLVAAADPVEPENVLFVLGQQPKSALEGMPEQQQRQGTSSSGGSSSGPPGAGSSGRGSSSSGSSGSGQRPVSGAAAAADSSAGPSVVLPAAAEARVAGQQQQQQSQPKQQQSQPKQQHLLLPSAEQKAIIQPPMLVRRAGELVAAVPSG